MARLCVNMAHVFDIIAVVLFMNVHQTGIMVVADVAKVLHGGTTAA